MPLELRLLTGLTLAVALVYAATPLAIRVADRLEFYDRPLGYKAHGTPTPYLGGAAVMAGFVMTVALLVGDSERTLPLLAGTVLMWVVGTWDDRRNVTPLIRVVIEIALAAGLWALDLAWNLGFGPAVDLAVTAVWVVAVVNAFNLFDNMDGATPSMGIVAAAGLCVLGAAQGSTWLAVTGAALCGACAGFLPHNLSRPARIFLGDGGSMPIGFAVATLTMIGVSDSAAAWQSLAMGLLFVGVPALDTTLVMISRRRRGISLLTGGRDHLTHRTRSRLGTARAVAIALGSAQAVISVLAVFALRGGSAAVVGAIALYLVGAGVAIAVLDNRWAPVEAPTAPAVGPPTAAARTLRRRRTSLAAIALLPVAVVLGAAPFAQGYYDSGYWVPAGVAVIAALTAATIAAPARLTRPTVLVIAGLVGLAAWSLGSTLWADSISAAVVEANRLLVYIAFAGLMLTLLRTDGASIVLIGALATASTVAGLVVVVRMFGPDASELFLNGRLNEPLGYINGEAAYFLLGAWCCFAVAEQSRYSLLSAAGAAGATMLLALVLLTQSRGVALATLLSVAVVVGLVPGRLRRAGALLTVTAAMAAAAPTLLDVYGTGSDGVLPSDTVRSAALAAALAALGAGAVWGVLTAVADRQERAVGRLRPIAVGAIVVVALGGLVVGVAERAAIADSVERQYSAFTQVGEGAPSGDTSSRLSSGAGNRYDYWRVAWGAFEERPLLGVGAGNYDRPYFQRRTTDEDITQPHSLPLQVLSELGLVGFALLLVPAFGVGWAAWRLARSAREAGGARFLAVAGVGCITAWAVHTSVDWLHLLPGVTAFALVACAVLLRNRAPVRAPSPVRMARGRRLAPVALIALALIVAGASLSRQYLSERFRSEGQDALVERPEEALRQADRSLRLDPEAVESYYLKAAALARFDQAGAARDALREAARREPRNFVTWALLGDLAVRSGNMAVAKQNYRRALALNPRDVGLRQHVRDAAR